MPGVLTILNAPALCLRIFFNVVSAGSGASVVAATIVVGVVVVNKWNDPDHPSDLFHDVSVVLKSDGTLAFNRAILSFELDEYYNATDTLLHLTEQLNAHLKQKFPNTFVKAITANFSLKPEISPTRKKRYPYCRKCYLKLMAAKAARMKRDNSESVSDDDGPLREDNPLLPDPPEPPSIKSTSTSTTTTTSSSTSTSTTTTTSTSTSTTTTSTSTSTTTTSTLTQITGNLDGSTSDSPTTTTTTTTSSNQITGDFESSTPVSQTTTKYTPFTTTATPSTTWYNISIANCTRSMFNGTNRTSVIYFMTTLYFNVTVKEELNAAEIIEALKSFNPIVELADKCIRKSPDTSTFNIALSKVDPPSSAKGDLSFLTKTDTIPPALINQVNLIIPPIVVATNSGNYTTSATTATTIVTTETTTTDSTTPNVG
ncbi:unnamed protein product [Adineta ricciae]|uniref:Uncharacterized protein n=1 Tax=Adineta ricciae TaxID=249248 RepID=A0A815QPZ8_ADIRI|nr:unnamed protein product [Adineta ricciae]